MYAAPFFTSGEFFHSAIVDDFFVGIGDINSSFLPKIEPLTTAGPVVPPKFAAPNGVANSSKTPNASVDTSPVLPLEEDETNVAEIQATKLSQSNAILDAQLEERPLAKKQEELQEHEVEEQKQKAQVSPPVTPPVKDPSTAPKPPKKALLKNDDYELIRIGNVSMEVVATLTGILSLIGVL